MKANEFTFDWPKREALSVQHDAWRTYEWVRVPYCGAPITNEVRADIAAAINALYRNPDAMDRVSPSEIEADTDSFIVRLSFKTGD